MYGSWDDFITWDRIVIFIMKHKQKTKLARKLRSRLETKFKVPIFQTNRWEVRKANIAARVRRKQEAAHKRALARSKQS